MSTVALGMFGLVACAALVALLTWLSLPLARRLRLVAVPGEHRRHRGAVPLSGGLAISLGLFLCLGAWGIYPGTGMALGWILLLLAGAIDDRFSLPFWTRFVVQIAAMLLLVWVDGVRLIDLGAVFSTEVVSLGSYSTALTVFAGVGVINAINMVDGMDGLAGSLVLVCVIGLTFSLQGAGPLPMDVAMLLAGAVLGFLAFNLRRESNALEDGGRGARVFLGDAGSMTLGFFLAWLLIDNSQGDSRSFPPVLALWLVALPLFDAVGVLVRRPLRGQSPFSADWLHTHHLLLRAGLGVNQSLVFIILVATALAASGIAMNQLGVAEHHLFYLFLGLFALYIVIMEWGDARLRGREHV